MPLLLFLVFLCLNNGVIPVDRDWRCWLYSACHSGESRRGISNLFSFVYYIADEFDLILSVFFQIFIVDSMVFNIIYSLGRSFGILLQKISLVH